MAGAGCGWLHERAVEYHAPTVEWSQLRRIGHKKVLYFGTIVARPYINAECVFKSAGPQSFGRRNRAQRKLERRRTIHVESKIDIATRGPG